jgi:transposase, IS5 family
MRLKSSIQESLKIQAPSRVKVVREYRGKYEKLDLILRANPQLLDQAHQEIISQLSTSETGRVGAFTSENLLRTVIVMFVEDLSYRDTVVRLDDSEVLREFVGLGWQEVMDPTFLSRAFDALSPETWALLNERLGQYAQGEKKIEGKKLRVDSTVVETEVHYPTDSSLLWDSARVLIRELRRARLELRVCGLHPRFHDRKIKRLYTFINRNCASKSKRVQRKVKSTYQQLIAQVRRIAVVTEALLDEWEEGALPELEKYLPRVQKVIHQAEQRIVHGVILPAEEKIYSLFEEHTELIKRGKAGKEVEFGHKVLIAQSGEKFITPYQVLPRRQEDPTLLRETLDAHRALFGKAPEVLATDKGFYEDREQIKKLEEGIKTVSMPKKGRRTPEEERRESSKSFCEGQRFRAGVEGTISVLKRVFKQGRCLFQGFKHYAASVGCAVFCYNLVLLTRL